MHIFFGLLFFAFAVEAVIGGIVELFTKAKR